MGPQKKILIIVTKGEVGGAQMSVLNLARQLRKKGEEVTVAFGEGDFLREELAKEDIPMVRFRWLRRTHNPLANFFFLREVLHFLNTNYFDVVHINSSNALFAARAAKKSENKPKTVFTFRGMSMLDPNYRVSSFKKKFYRKLFKFLLRNVDVPVFVSRHNLQLAEKEGLVRGGRLIRNGLSPEETFFFSRNRARWELLSSYPVKEGIDNIFLLGSIGRLHYQKNYEFLIDIFPEIINIKPNAYAIIIGDGPKKEEYQKMIKERELEERIFLVGSAPNASRYLKAFDLFTLPSRYEGLSVTLVECLFAGIPVLASNVGGAAEMFDPEQLYEPENKEQFLEKFRQLASAEEVRRRAGEANLSNAARFTIDGTAKEYERVYGTTE